MKNLITDTVVALIPKGRHIEHPIERKASMAIIWLCVFALAGLTSQMVKAKGETGRLKNALIENTSWKVEEPVYENKLFFENDNLLPDGTNLSKLSYAVAMAETHNCEKDTNFTRYNNCFGIILSEGIARYKTKQESHEHFKDIWRRMYGRFPDRKLAIRYTGNDRADTWLSAVRQYYGTP